MKTLGARTTAALIMLLLVAVGFAGEAGRGERGGRGGCNTAHETRRVLLRGLGRQVPLR